MGMGLIHSLLLFALVRSLLSVCPVRQAMPMGMNRMQRHQWKRQQNQLRRQRERQMSQQQRQMARQQRQMARQQRRMRRQQRRARQGYMSRGGYSSDSSSSDDSCGHGHSSEISYFVPNRY